MIIETNKAYNRSEHHNHVDGVEPRLTNHALGQNHHHGFIQEE